MVGTPIDGWPHRGPRMPRQPWRLGALPPLWIHGNVPRGVDHRLGKTRVVANPRVGERGYAGFDPALVVEA